MARIGDDNAKTTPGGRRTAAGFTVIELLVVISIIAILVALGSLGAVRMARMNRLNQAKALLNNLVSVMEQYESIAGVKVNHSWKNSGEIAVSDNNAQKERFNWRDDEFTYTNENIKADSGGSKELLDNSGKRNTAKLDTEPAAKPTSESEYTAAAKVSSERWVWAMCQIPGVRDALDNVGQGKFLKDTDANGFLEVIDPWGKPVLYAAYVDYGDKVKMDDFLPEHKQWEAASNSADAYKQPIRYQDKWKPFFVSAGADGVWGNMSSDFNPDPSSTDPNDLNHNRIFDASEDNLLSNDLEGGVK
ncbi:MAG: type II secretion system protein [Phycisphaeraceae bacterium]|nr:type II secretion system protein [Phycisphaeraceae bacterium]